MQYKLLQFYHAPRCMLIYGWFQCIRLHS